MSGTAQPSIYVDADACPVKDEIYRVAERYGLAVHVVANAPLRVPRHPLFTLVVVEAGADKADDWIAEQVAARDVVVTSDIPLADRCLKAGAIVLSATGKLFTTDSIGMALAQRSVMEHLRSFGEGGGGPKPFGKAERSRFLSALDTAVTRALRG